MIDHPPLTRNAELAFLTGMILGDGHIAKFPRTEQLKITLGTDKPELWKFTTDIVGEVFNKQPTVQKRSRSNCLDIVLYQKQISERLEIPSGSKGSLNIKLHKWIWDKETYLIKCLRGLFEAEGSLSIHKPTYTYNFKFSNKNISLLDEVEKALKALGYNPERRKDAVRLRRKQEVSEFEKLISFRNYTKI